MSELIAYCGLDCKKCDAFIATQANDTKRLKEVAERWTREQKTEFSQQEVLCDGCRSQRISGWCTRLCLIRPCAELRNVKTCAHCSDYTCKILERFLSDEPAARDYLGEIRKTIHGLV